MNLINIFLANIFAVLQVTQAENVFATNQTPGILTECGQTLIADNGTIQYKLNEIYNAGELCVFMIKFESGNVDTTFTLDTHGLSDSDDDAIKVYKTWVLMSFQANLGPNQQTVDFFGYGAVVIFKTGSSSGTGFQLSFKRNAVNNPRTHSETYAVFDNEEESSLNIPFPSNYSGGGMYNYFFFTSGNRLVTEPDTVFNLTVKAFYENDGDSCDNLLQVYSFVNELAIEGIMCVPGDDGVVYEFSTRGMFFVHQIQSANRPTTTGVITWKKVSTK